MPSNSHLMWKYFLASLEGQPRYQVLLLLWRGLQSLRTRGGAFWEMPMLNSCRQQQKGRVKVSHGKERGAWFPWRKTDLSLQEIHGSPQACLGRSNALTQPSYQPAEKGGPGQITWGNFLSTPSLRSSNIKTSTPWYTLEYFDFWVLQRT